MVSYWGGLQLELGLNCDMFRSRWSGVVLSGVLGFCYCDIYRWQSAGMLYWGGLFTGVCG